MRKTVFSSALAAVILFTSCGKFGNSNSADDVKNSKSIFAMDTYITVTSYGEDTDKALQAAEDKITSLEKLWSVTDETSEIYAINHSGGQSVKVSPETADLLYFALDMNKRTNGAFDISLYPVLTAWGFTTDEYRVPGDKEIADLLESAGVEKISLNNQTVQIPTDMQIDLGAIGKGYAGDLIAKELRSNGVKSALIDLGGNIQTVGTKPDKEKWKVGIRSPFGEGNFATLEIGECAIVTSGGYERYFVEDGVTYWHILDPKTGKPADSGIASVSVIGSEGRTCDALSTSLFVLGLDKATELWRESDDFEMIIVTSDGEIYITEGIEDDFELSNNFADPKVSVIYR
ncbi:MAG: FAD:protein FMN transferase [Ruminococcus sp.]|nr:FAD:protein FMN transferase [Ruminococcus sp.]